MNKKEKLVEVNKKLKQDLETTKEVIDRLTPEKQNLAKQVVRKEIKVTLEEAKTDKDLLVAAMALLSMIHNDPFVDLFIEKMFDFDMKDFEKEENNG